MDQRHSVPCHMQGPLNNKAPSSTACMCPAASVGAGVGFLRLVGAAVSHVAALYGLCWCYIRRIAAPQGLFWHAAWCCCPARPVLVLHSGTLLYLQGLCWPAAWCKCCCRACFGALSGCRIAIIGLSRILARHADPLFADIAGFRVAPACVDAASAPPACWTRPASQPTITPTPAPTPATTPQTPPCHRPLQVPYVTPGGRHMHAACSCMFKRALHLQPCH